MSSMSSIRYIIFSMLYILLLVTLASCSKYTAPSISVKENTSYFSNTHNINNADNIMYESTLDYYITLSWVLGILNTKEYRYDTDNNWTQKY